MILFPLSLEKNLEKGIIDCPKSGGRNLDMKLYFKLIIEKFRMAIILQYAPKLEKEMAGDLSEEDLEFLKGLIKADKDGILRSTALSILLEAYGNIDKAFVSELPLEMALIKILSKE